MSDALRIFGSVPTGRRVEQPGHDPGYIGTLGPLRRADEARLRLARRNLREVEVDAESQGLHLVDATGTVWEVITAFVDLIDVKKTGAEAFCIRDGWLVVLRRPGWTNEADESHYAGEVFGRRAEPRDPMPMPTDIF